MNIGNGPINIWESVAGLALFLIGMSYLEDGLKQLTGRKFKLFLRKQSTSKLSAIGSAAIVTGILQSSSVVNLMVLALVGTGIINMQHALALMLGANLGTTLDTWFVATVGFKVNIEAFAIPIIGVAGICSVLFKKGSSWYNWSNFLLGIGFLFFGLDLMKNGINSIVTHFDLRMLNHYPVILFVLIGLVITALIQSSSATVAIVLSAIHVNAISLYSATAIVLGSEIGTTLKLMIASMGGMAVKKRVALGNFLYNIIGTVIILLFLRPVNSLITNVIGIKDPLIALSFFQTFINFIGIVMFFPLLDVFGKFLERLFVHNNDRPKYISKTPIIDVEIALEALQKEAMYFLDCVIYFSRKVFDINGDNTPDAALPEKYTGIPEMEQYDYLKELHGDIYIYCMKLQNETLAPDEAQTLDRLTSSVRNAIYAAKSIKDAFYDVEQLKNSGNDAKYKLYLAYREKATSFYNQLLAILPKEKGLYFEEMVRLQQLAQDGYLSALAEVYKVANTSKLNEMEISTVINFNREFYTSFKSIILALKDGVLTTKDAAYFDDLPGFIH